MEAGPQAAFVERWRHCCTAVCVRVLGRRTELFDYQRVIFYAVVTSVVALDRVQLKAKVRAGPGGGALRFVRVRGERWGVARALEEA